MTKTKKIFLPLYNDIIFTEIFNNPDNIEILENFLENYFNYELGSLRNKVVLKHRYLSIANKKEARKQVDILIELDDKTSINLELNNTKRKDIFVRNRIYLSKVHGQKLKKNTRDYNTIGRTIQINLNTKIRNKKELIERWYITNEVTKEKVNDIEIDIDHWPHIPPYIEVEAHSEKDIFDFLHLIGYTKEDTVSMNADDVYTHYGLDMYSYKELKFDN